MKFTEENIMIKTSKSIKRNNKKYLLKNEIYLH